VQYNNWYLKFDNDFARIFLLGLPFRPLPSTVQPCSWYSAIISTVYTVTTYTISVSDLYSTAENCSIYRLLLQAFRRFREDNRNIDITLIPSALSIGARGTRVLQFCADLSQCL